jgi:geranyl-CoA carboxylase beta subunit
MSAFVSRINTTSDQFAKNKEDLLKLVEKMRALEKRAEAKSELRRPIFNKRGQLSPRERLSALLDPGLPFLELYNMASYLVDDPDPETTIPRASVTLGIGLVSGVRCMVFY